MSYFDVDKRRAGLLPTIDATGSLPSPGAEYAPAYQISGIPYVTASTAWSNTKIEFPGVTQWIQVNSTSGVVSFSFVNGVEQHKSFKIAATGQSTGIMRLRTATIYVTGNGSIVAGLTNVQSSSLHYDVSQFSY